VSDEDFTPLSVTMNGIVPQLETAAKTDNGDNRKRVNEGDFVINSRSDRKGSAGVSNLEGSVSVISTVLTPRPGLNSRFVHYLLRSQPFQEEYYRFGTGIVADLWSTRYSSMKRIALAIPTSSEQETVAGFLDSETAQIDGLIRKQKRLIELLAEKRQAIITRAVTKGLDPTAPTNPSGIPWLGDVNASWAVRPLKAAGRINLGKMIQPSPKTETDFIAPYLRAANVQPNGVLALGDVKNMWFNESELRSLDVRSGDVLVVEGGIGGFGRAAYVDHDLPGFGYQNSINCIRPSESVDGRFLTYLLLAARHAGYIHAYCTGVSMPHLTAEKLAAIRVPLPDRGTQTQISDRLDAQFSKLNALSAKASAVITILNERRSALISAAVTGKINVQAKGVSV
jgi:type I restriction enzyme S subunit